MKKISKYFRNILLAIDIFALAVFGIVPLILSLFGFNVPLTKSRQTISGYLGSNYDGSIFELGVNKLFNNRYWKLWNGTDHCSNVADVENRSELIN